MAKSLQFPYSTSDFVLETSSWQEPTHKSKFDKELMSQWDNAVTKGCFRYTLEDLQTKVIPGQMKYIAQLNIKRAIERRKPQDMSSVTQPFNPNQFNFTKIKDNEVLLELCPTSPDMPGSNGTTTNHVIAQEHSVNGGSKLDANDNADEENSLQPATKRQKTNGKHVLIINVSPLEYCNSLLVPNMEGCHPQVLTKDGIQVAIDMLLLSSNRGFRVCYNSLCAFASVNHLHFHAYYLQHEMEIETTHTQLVHGPCHELLDWPARGFVFQLTDNDVDSLASHIFTVADHLIKKEIAHNLFLTRGAPLGTATSNGTTQNEQETVRAVLWPRKSTFGAKSDAVFNVAVAELAGHIPIYTQDGYDSMTEEKIVGYVKDVSLSQQEFDALKEDITKLL